MLMNVKLMLLNCQKRLWLNSSADMLTAFSKDNIPSPHKRLWQRSWWFGKKKKSTFPVKIM